MEGLSFLYKPRRKASNTSTFIPAKIKAREYVPPRKVRIKSAFNTPYPIFPYSRGAKYRP